MNIEILRIYEDYITTIFTLACSSWWHQIFETYRRNVKRRTECVSEEFLREKEMEPDWEINSTDVDMESRRRRGRPSFDVKEEQLSFLVENDFKVPEISLMLGVSTRTVERRLSSFGISISGKLEDLVLRLYWCTDKRIVKPPPTEGFTLIYVSKRDALINLNWYVYTYISFTFVTPTD